VINGNYIFEMIFEKEIVRTKKALSPVIATVLLLALVFVLAVLVFIYFRGFLSEQVEKFGQPIERVCDNVLFDVRLNEQDTSYSLEIVNRGNAPIYYFDLKEVAGGDSDTIKLDVSLDGGEGIIENPVFGDETEEIILYPVILGKVKGERTKKPFVCIEQGKTITL
jgi:flagellin-like protein